MDGPIFMGVCSNVVVHGDGVYYDLINFGELMAYPYYPMHVNAFVVLAFPPDYVNSTRNFKLKLKVRDSDTSIEYDIKLESITEDNHQLRLSGQKSLIEKDIEYYDNGKMKAHRSFKHNQDNYTIQPLPTRSLMLTQPGAVDVQIIVDEKTVTIGSFLCVPYEVKPFSNEELVALTSKPGFVSEYVFVLSCKKCDDHIRIKISLKDGIACIADNNNLSAVPATWSCDCQSTILPLQYFKDGYYEVFRQKSLTDATAISPYKESRAKVELLAMCNDFGLLIEQEHSEEVYQKFLEEHHVFWHTFSPTRIWYKKPILSKFKTDFAILSSSKTLYLIEIEKPSTRLLNKDGSVNADANKGIEQLKTWKHVIEDARPTVLSDGFNLKSEDVHVIKYIMIAGVGKKYDDAPLRRLKSQYLNGDTHIMTYDDLISCLHTTLLLFDNS